jgi:hypothetical protein
LYRLVGEQLRALGDDEGALQQFARVGEARTGISDSDNDGGN